MTARPVMRTCLGLLLIGPHGLTGTAADGYAPSYSPSMSAGGVSVAFASRADTLAAGDSNGTDDVFVRDDGRLIRASVGADGAQGDAPSYSPSISGDGNVIAFESEAALVADDGHDGLDVFLHARSGGGTTLVSRAPGGGSADGRSFSPSITADGRFVAFGSEATNLVAGDANDTEDVFVYDVSTETLTLVSAAADGTPSDGRSFSPSISNDGRYVAFASFATNLVAHDTNGMADIFVHDRRSGATMRAGGVEGDASSFGPSISGDGRSVAFASFATNLVADDTNEALDAFVHDLTTGETTRVSVASDGTQADSLTFTPRISGDGRFVAFKSDSTNLVAGDTNGVADVFVHDRRARRTTRVSVDSSGAEGNGPSVSPSLSADGRAVAFASAATNLVADDTNGAGDVFVHDVKTGETRRLSVPGG